MSTVQEPDHPLDKATRVPIERIEFQVPMTNSYAGECMYVRECFDQYYDWILGNINGKYPLVTLTGTPGIGKSMFHVYFFQRLNREYPRVRIVTATLPSRKPSLFLWTQARMRKRLWSLISGGSYCKIEGPWPTSRPCPVRSSMHWSWEPPPWTT